MVITQVELIAELRKLISQVGSARRAAILLGVSRQMLSQVLKGDRPPGHKIPAALKLKRVGQVYETVGNG